MLKEGKLDGYISLDNSSDMESMIPVAKIGYSEIYFAVNKNRPDLLEDLNMALRSIQNQNRFYNDDLFAKYVQSKGTRLFIDNKEKKWLS